MSKHKEAAIRICECFGIDEPFIYAEEEEYYEFVKAQLEQVERETWNAAASILDGEVDRCWGIMDKYSTLFKNRGSKVGN